MKNAVLSILLITLFSQFSYSQKIKKSSGIKIVDPVEIRLDNIAFDEDSYLRVLDNENNVIAYYDRLNFNQIYTLVPFITNQGFEIHIRDTNGARGYVNINPRLTGFKVAHDSEVSYFQKSYDFNILANFGIGKVGVEKLISYKNETVMANKTSVSITSGIKQTPLLVSRQFFDNNKLDAVNWSLILRLTEELSYESSRNDNRLAVRTRTLSD